MLDDTRSDNVWISFYNDTKNWSIQRPWREIMVHLLYLCMYMLIFSPGYLWLLWGRLSFGGNWGYKGESILCKSPSYSVWNDFYMEQLLIPT